MLIVVGVVVLAGAGTHFSIHSFRCDQMYQEEEIAPFPGRLRRTVRMIVFKIGLFIKLSYYIWPQMGDQLGVRLRLARRCFDGFCLSAGRVLVILIRIRLAVLRLVLVCVGFLARKFLNGSLYLLSLVCWSQV